MKSEVVEMIREIGRMVEEGRGEGEGKKERGGEEGKEKQLEIEEIDDGDGMKGSPVPSFHLLLHTASPPSRPSLRAFLSLSPSSPSTKDLQLSISFLSTLFHTRNTHPLPPPTHPSFPSTSLNIRSSILSSLHPKLFFSSPIFGSILSHLACYLTTLHNQGQKHINFNQMQSRLNRNLVETQKQFGVSSYVKKVRYRIKERDLPVGREQIMKVHEVSIREAFEELAGVVGEGMGLGAVGEFVEVWREVLRVSGEQLQGLMQQNRKASIVLNQTLIDDILQLPEITSPTMQTLLSSSLPSTFTSLLSLYLSKSISPQSLSLFPSLYTPLLTSLITHYQSLIHDNLKHIHQLQTKSLVLTQRNTYLQKQNQRFRERIEQCYDEKQVISYINESRENEQMENGREELLKKRREDKRRISGLEKEIQGLEGRLAEEIIKRKALQQDLIDLTQRYQHILTKQKSKTSKPITIIGQLSSDLKSSIQTFDKISTRVHKMQSTYKYAKQIMIQNKKLTQDLQKKQNINKQMEIEHQKLYRNIETYNSTIGELQWNSECYKETIRELQGDVGVLKVGMAEMDGKVQVYGKCLGLIKGWVKTGKREGLWGFIRVSQYQDIRGQVEELFQ